MTKSLQKDLTRHWLQFVLGRQLVKAMQESKEISIEGVLDDDENKQGYLIDGKNIFPMI